MSQEKVPCKRHKPSIEDEEASATSQNPPFLQCAELILPWLNPLELANISLTCKTLHQISSSITTRRSIDASRSFENLKIPFHNTIDQHPYNYFIYTPSQTLNSPSHSLRQPWGYLGSRNSGRPDRLDVDSVSQLAGACIVVGCYCEKCDDDEVEGSCPCLSLGLAASECGPSCDCGLECRNRLTQRGISVVLKIVRDERKGWCLYAAQRISDGQFVCEYAGELLTTEEARRRQETYDELSLSGKLSPALLVVREHLPSGNACLRINIDATRVGNVARFINHSCDGGNLSTKLVRSSGTFLPRLCFFASKQIEAGEELAFSYGEIRLSSSRGMQCFCGSSCCVGTLPSEKT